MMASSIVALFLQPSTTTTSSFSSSPPTSTHHSISSHLERDNTMMDISTNTTMPNSNEVQQQGQAANCNGHLNMLSSSSCEDNKYDHTVGSVQQHQQLTTRFMEEPEQQPILTIQRRPRSGSEGLDYLAYLAEQERRDLMTIEEGKSFEHQEELHNHISAVVITPPTSLNHQFTDALSCSSTSFNTTTATYTSTSDSDDTEMMPPPQPRRPRSISNPDSMMKMIQKQHFVLPPHLLKQELAEARGAVVRKAAAMIERESFSMYKNRPDQNSSNISYCGIHEEDVVGVDEELDNDDDYEEDDNDVEVIEKDSTTPKCHESTMSSTELLRLARSRLLEDLLTESSSSNSYCDGNQNDVSTSTSKGNTMLILPHNLSKYKTVYNQNGRIGIYTAQERAAIIERYLMKRLNRDWNKKIRYNCRKSLADRRLRVKGRFVKRSIEITAQQNHESESQHATIMNSDNDDDIMPDITDPDAGFCPTKEQPYRRLRRHTVT